MTSKAPRPRRLAPAAIFAIITFALLVLVAVQVTTCAFTPKPPPPGKLIRGADDFFGGYECRYGMWQEVWKGNW